MNDIAEYILCHNFDIFFKYLLSKYDFWDNIHKSLFFQNVNHIGHFSI